MESTASQGTIGFSESREQTWTKVEAECSGFINEDILGLAHVCVGVNTVPQ